MMNDNILYSVYVYGWPLQLILLCGQGLNDFKDLPTFPTHKGLLFKMKIFDIFYDIKK